MAILHGALCLYVMMHEDCWNTMESVFRGHANFQALDVRNRELCFITIDIISYHLHTHTNLSNLGPILKSQNNTLYFSGLKLINKESTSYTMMNFTVCESVVVYNLTAM